MPVVDAHAEILAQIAFGQVLETGYGFGVSSRAIAGSDRVESVTSWEPHKQYWPELEQDKITVIGGDRWPTTGKYDFVFLDHWPLPGETRKEAARFWRATGAVVVVDDANIEPELYNEAYKIEGMWLMK